MTAAKSARRRSAFGDLWPAWMRRETVAAYVDLSPSGFDQYVKRGLLPQPRIVGEAKLWSREEVDSAIKGGDSYGEISSSNAYLERLSDAETLLTDSGATASRALRAGQG